VFLSSYPVQNHGLGVLHERTYDPGWVYGQCWAGPVMMRIEQAHPIFTNLGYRIGDWVTVISGGAWDYQNYGTWSGANIASSQMPYGCPWMIGVKTVGSYGSRWVIMGSFGACYATNTSHWTWDAKHIFGSAVDWAKKGF